MCSLVASEERTASIFRLEQHTKEETSMIFDPENGGRMLLRNVGKLPQDHKTLLLRNQRCEYLKSKVILINSWFNDIFQTSVCIVDIRAEIPSSHPVMTSNSTALSVN
jgi:hypothetical protein